ncbi:MAG: hypothetical protein AVDCRST_MAG14-1380 [uncultured Rubrobacteraceae bacterium]|uniref:Gram-positive cocci surface proteins LPxTG domain-containing protein n=1 Tax=uncultured Rubrobacteraceae bacterium TaxID=349277 RepID=A0A6J4QTE5_9ACTN|nr:MAG: hypothetical protein AVDCRST_MAG14-1380 [uncultured Rubrobacteraceae bacterium]
MLLLATVLAAMLAAASPALAESEPVFEATGVLEKPEVTTYQYGTHAITDEASGNRYALQSQSVDLDAYAGERVTVSGAPVPGYQDGQVEGGPDLLRVDQVEPADGPPGPPPGEEFARLSFELTVECEPPAGATFLGFTTLESVMTTPLTDPDGDGLYTGSMTVNKFPPGPRPVPSDIEPISLSPVRIVQGPPTGSSALGPEFRVIKDFGSVELDEDKTLAASVSFCDGGDSGGSDGGGSDNSSGGGSGMKVLPATGGTTLPTVGLVGALLLVGGLLARRCARQ